MKRLAILALALAWPAHAYASGCHEVSHVVGYEQCTWFGTWSRDVDKPPLWLELGVFSHEYTSEPFTLDQSVARAQIGDQLGTHAVGGTLRLLAGSVFYAGIELEPGGLATSPKPLGVVPVGYSSDVEAHVIGGVHAMLWRFELGTELAAGGRLEALANCNAKQAGCHQVEVLQTSRQLEARVHADVFVTPRWSIGLMWGRSLIDANDHMFLVYTGAHFRALDGAP